MKYTLRDFALSEIRQLVHNKVSFFKPEDTASKALGELKDTGRYEALVTARGRIGLITIRDLLDVSQPEKTKLDGIWRVIKPLASSDRVIDASEEIIRNNVSAIPVVGNGVEFGCISQIDVIDGLCNVPELSGIPAKGLIHLPVVTINAEEKVALARRLMIEKGFSHIPVVENNKLIAVATAENIVYTYTAPISKTTTGDRVGERVVRFPGLIKSIADLHPFTVGPEASALEVVLGLRDRRKSACVMINQQKDILGILAPKDLIALVLRFKVEEVLPVYILGLSEEDFFEKAVAEDKLRRVIIRNVMKRPKIEEVSVRIKRQQTQGLRTRYEVKARAMSAEEQFIAEADGWDLLEVFDELCKTLDKVLRRSINKPGRTRSRRRSRFRR